MNLQLEGRIVIIAQYGMLYTYYYLNPTTTLQNRYYYYLQLHMRKLKPSDTKNLSKFT